MGDDQLRDNRNLRPRLSEWEIKLADDALVLAYAMARKYHSMWVENHGQTDEYTMIMLPHAIKILTTSRAWPTGEEDAF
jgi:ABC-type molybdate transport system substrate-binding protein